MSLIDELRKEFEEIPQVKLVFDRNEFVFNVSLNQYFVEGLASDIQKIGDVNFIDGAWFMFQELRK